jgi:hypothetical protein
LEVRAAFAAVRPRRRVSATYLSIAHLTLSISPDYLRTIEPSHPAVLDYESIGTNNCGGRKWPQWPHSEIAIQGTGPARDDLFGLAIHLARSSFTCATPGGDGLVQQRQSARPTRPSCTLRLLRRKVWPRSLLSLPHRALFKEVRRAFQDASAERQPLAVAISRCLRGLRFPRKGGTQAGRSRGGRKPLCPHVSRTHLISTTASPWEAPNEVRFGQRQDAISEKSLRALRRTDRRGWLSAGHPDAALLLRRRMPRAPVRRNRDTSGKPSQGLVTRSRKARAF